MSDSYTTQPFTGPGHNSLLAAGYRFCTNARRDEPNPERRGHVLRLRQLLGEMLVEHPIAYNRAGEYMGNEWFSLWSPLTGAEVGGYNSV